MESNRVFREEEATEILRRAAQLDVSRPDLSSEASSSLTYIDLRRIALEAGIEESALQSAIRSPRKRKTGFLNLVEEHEWIFDAAAKETFLALNGRRSFWAIAQVGTRAGATHIIVRNKISAPYLCGLHAPLILAVVLLPVLGATFSVWLGIAMAACSLTLGALLFGWFASIGMTKARALAADVQEAVSAVATRSHQNRN